MTRVLDVLIDVATGPLAWPALAASAVAVLWVARSGRGTSGQAVALVVAGVAVLVTGGDVSILGAAVLVVAGEEVGLRGGPGAVGGGSGSSARRGFGSGSRGRGAAARGRVGQVAGVLLVALGVGIAVAVTPLYPGRLQIVAALLAVVVVPALLDIARPADRIAGLLLPVTLVGIYATVPDTKLAVIAVAASLPTILRGSAGLHGIQSWSLVLLVAASGGVPRTASLIGAIGCLGVFLIPAAHRIPRWAVLIVHVAMVGIASRVAGLGSDVGMAALIVAATVAGGWVLLTRGGR